MSKVQPNTKSEMRALIDLPEGTPVECAVFGGSGKYAPWDGTHYDFTHWHYRPAKRKPVEKWLVMYGNQTGEWVRSAHTTLKEAEQRKEPEDRIVHLREVLPEDEPLCEDEGTVVLADDGAIALVNNGGERFLTCEDHGTLQTVMCHAALAPLVGQRVKMQFRRIDQ